MLISLKWLKDYVEVKEDINDLEHALTMIGQEVEAIEIQGEYLENVVVGQVVEYDRHPDAEKLSLLKVDAGEEELLQIICGAPNHKKGDKVIVAKIGAVLPGDFKIKKSKIRGVESQGMLCSEKELGLGESHEGIIILPSEAVIGTPAKEYFELDDIVFELEITPNRPDCLSHIGIAREVAAYYKRKIKYPQAAFSTVSDRTENQVKVFIEDKERCKRYTTRLIRNVSVKESPKWLQTRLRAVGLRPINNIVDITNYVLMEYNQPMHAFDFSKISGDEIIIREAKDGEKILTLDDEERELNNKELVIADSVKAIAIAGVMGGANTQVDENTTDVLLEVAYFEPTNIRKTSKNLGLSSDSSYRFERGVDIENNIAVINRATALIKELAGGDVLEGMVDKYIEKFDKKEVSLTLDKLNKFIGKNLTIDEVGSILTNLNFELVSNNDGCLTVSAPSYRLDIERTADLYEEVIRMYGFENIEDKLPESSVKSGNIYEEIERVDKMKKVLVNLGLQEVINYSFFHEDALDILNSDKEDIVRIKNPITEDFAIMRTSLVYSLLSNIRDNFNRNIFDLNLFEVSRVFTKGEEGLANEKVKAIIALAGKNDKDVWDVKPKSYDFFDLKGYVESFLEAMGLKNYQLKRTENTIFHPGRAADIMVGRDLIGTFGEIHPDVAEKMDIDKERVYVAEIDTVSMMKYARTKIKYKGISKYPAVQRDLAIVVDKDILVGNMTQEIKKSSKLIEKVELFDIYEGEKVGDNKKSVAVNIVMRSDSDTLKEEEVNKTVEKILSVVSKKYGGEIRQ